jgi:hypothetical protein
VTDDLTAYRLTPEMRAAPLKKRKPSKARRRESNHFIKLPIGLAVEVREAVSLTAYVVWTLLLYMELKEIWRRKRANVAVEKGLPFPCPSGLLRRFGISRGAKARALGDLAAAGFIAISEQLPGRAPIVTLIVGSSA